MTIRLYNTLSHQLEDFTPIEGKTVRMYNCGPTVYDFAHIGNFRAFVFADLLRRFLEFAGYEVNQVMNITDVGHMTEDQLADGGGQDKMELAAERLKSAKKQGAADVDNPDNPYEVARYFETAFLDDAHALRLKIADDDESHRPRATEHIAQMIALIEKLIATDHAYVADDGAVYYDVQSFDQYGRLSGNTLDKLAHGAGGRVSETQTAGKRNPHDFLLWKPDPAHLMKWDSPWGEGYPGWHVECSAMSMAALGVETLDIHTGGEDNIFPHHECEIAQSCGATGKPFANYWLHTRFLLVEGEKMSKSKGNFHTVRDLLTRGVDPAVLRFELMRTHYRKNMNFTMKGLNDAASRVSKLRNFKMRCERLSNSPTDADLPDDTSEIDRKCQYVEEYFGVRLSNDLNISGAIGIVFKWMNSMRTRNLNQKEAHRVLSTISRIDSVLGVIDEYSNNVENINKKSRKGKMVTVQGEGGFNLSGSGNAKVVFSDKKIRAMCKDMENARAEKDFATSDAIRDELNEAGVEVRVTPDGITWKRKMKLD